MSRASAWLTLGLFASLLLVFVAERILGAGTAQSVVRAVAATGLVLGLGLRVMRLQKASAAGRVVEMRLLGFYVLVVVAIGLYLLTLPEFLAGRDFSPTAETRWTGALSALWPALLVVGALATLFTELAYRKMPVDEAVEVRRINVATASGLGIAFTLIFVFSANYVALKKEVKRDLSYFRTSKPSGGSSSLVKRLGEPVKAYLFFPEVNEVLEQVRPYFEELDDASDQLSIEVRDHALEPELSRTHRVRANGFVVLVKGDGSAKNAPAEKIEIGVTLEAARTRLKKLDSDFQKAFSKLTQERRELYITTGHEERSDDHVDGHAPGEQIRELRKALERSNIQTRELGLSQGLGSAVPSGAKAVAIIGPRKPFLKEEAEALLRYVQDGGRLVVMVDPDLEHGLEPLLKGLGLKINKGVVLSDTKHLRRDNTDADKALIFSNRYTSHPTVTVASRNASRVMTVFIRSGSLVSEAVPTGTQVVFPIKSGPQFYLDVDGDFKRGESEALGSHNLMAAVEVGGEDGGRAVVLADGDLVSDQLVRFPGNILVFSDILQWLVGEEQIIGDVSTEEDVRIEHTSEQDKKWFYGASFIPPMIPMAIGVWLALRRRRKEKR